jgi:hypothetical protein
VGPSRNITGPAYSEITSPNTVIIAGTVGSSQLIDQLIFEGRLNVSTITNQWESFSTQILHNPLPGVDSALVIAGSDARGTIYGLYDISEQIGVSPWYWWADVPSKQASDIWVTDGKVQGAPSVKYRGLFLNDEQPALTNWIKCV